MKNTRGFTLIEIAVVLVIAGFLLAMGLRVTGAFVEAQRRYATRDHMTLADTALATFASQRVRLPCPADGALPAADPNYGLEQRTPGGDCGTQARGVLPWRTVGMSEQDSADGFFVRLTYRVAPGLARDNAMNFADCDPAGGATFTGAAPFQTCNTGCTTATLPACTNALAIVAGRGLTVRDSVAGVAIADPAASSGAAYVLVSHGPNRARGYSPDGVLQADSGAVGAGEVQNDGSAPLAAFYVDQNPTDAADATHFDDVLSRPQILMVASRANLAPRAH